MHLYFSKHTGETRVIRNMNVSSLCFWTNATSLIYLAKVEKLDLLIEVFHMIQIPEKVYNKVVIRGKNIFYHYY